MQTDLQYDANGLIPAIIQDDASGDVLTLFWMNDDAVTKTLESKRVWRYSRQHQQLMLKGDTSGNYLDVKTVLYDCHWPRLPHRRAHLLLPLFGRVR
jgi:phosphoribosyl-ATP pyrophosphohydrolase/phosphoribosyl-AMP cyclohydrolase